MLTGLVSVSIERIKNMGVVSMAKDIKKVHPDAIVCYKVGAFIQTFGKDAYIVSYLFDYSLRDAAEDVPTSGFPKNAIPKVCAKLEQKKINYVIIDTKNDYDVDEKFDVKNLNQYNIVLEKARKYIKIKKRLKSIEEELLEQFDDENIAKKIERIEEIAYESRKV